MTPLRWPWQDRPRVSGRPPSPNGASSFHLVWLLGPSEVLVEVSAVLEVLAAPAVDSLYFWALQASFAEGGRDRGGAHVGLQWNNRHPGNRAVNWGGYAAGGSLLEGTESPLPSTPHDPNTRDYAWQPGRPYQLRVSPAPGQSGFWQGAVTDLVSGEATVVRSLAAGGDRLLAPVVWSEVFARCDDPSVSVRWSGLEGVTADGNMVVPRGLTVNYQARPAGGCDNTDVAIDDEGGVLQTTNTPRTVALGSVIALPGATG